MAVQALPLAAPVISSVRPRIDLFSVCMLMLLTKSCRATRVATALVHSHIKGIQPGW